MSPNSSRILSKRSLNSSGYTLSSDSELRTLGSKFSPHAISQHNTWCVLEEEHLATRTQDRRHNTNIFQGFFNQAVKI